MLLQDHQTEVDTLSASQLQSRQEADSLFLTAAMRKNFKQDSKKVTHKKVSREDLYTLCAEAILIIRGPIVPFKAV